ncbi:MAG: Lrp/AsnC family transcriptional regulator [Candidatus Omnitrophica bacterium]|nr:Lrp/AsnC family transcriptional regulator [Candidatus Omnitrophota bacterium]
MEDVLKILEGNARISFEDLAKLTGEKEPELRKMVNKLEKKGVIVKYKAVINKELLPGERSVLALIEVKVSPQKDVGFDAIAERIYKFPEVKSCYLLSGTYDLLLVVEGKSIHTIADFVAEKLAPLEAVKGTVTHFMLKKYKEDGVILRKKKEIKRLTITY